MAQMLGENEDSYVQSYIQTQNTGIACEMLQLLERGENGGQRTTKHNSLRVETMPMQDCQSAVVGGA